MTDGIPVDELAAPATRARNGRQQVRSNTPFDSHALPIPEIFLEVFDAFVFFGALALGLRASLLERSCPLAIASAFPIIP